MSTKPQSMTGFGKSEAQNKQLALSVEIRSVNSRYLDLNFKLPMLYNQFEPTLQNIVREYVQRGRLDVFVTRTVLDPALDNISVNQDLFNNYWSVLSDSIKSAADKGATVDPTQLGTYILGKNNFIVPNYDPESVAQEETLMIEALREAVTNLQASRESEASRLTKLLAEHVSALKQTFQEIKKQKASIVERLYQDMLAKLKQLFDEVDFSSERIEQEAAIRIERSDITEEVSRIDSHLEVLQEEIDTNAKGKKVEFLTQELNREFNTISAKTNAANIQQLVVNAKMEIEKIKEQSFNLE